MLFDYYITITQAIVLKTNTKYHPTPGQAAHLAAPDPRVVGTSRAVPAGPHAAPPTRSARQLLRHLCSQGLSVTLFSVFVFVMPLLFLSLFFFLKSMLTVCTLQCHLCSQGLSFTLF